MEHAHHFLHRLDRLSVPHVELALSLYRDHKLLKVVLDSAQIPEGADRVALSLADPKLGPFIVLTREGKFVTCLGEGMRKGDLPVITREKLDGVATRVEVLRKRIEVAGINTGERAAVGKLFRMVYDGGSRLSRESFQEAAAWQPLLLMEYWRWMVDTANDVGTTREVLVRQLRRTDKLNPQFDDVLRNFSKSVWFIGHMAALTALDGKVAFEEWSAKIADVIKESTHGWTSVRQGLVGPALRGIWGSGRMGKMLLQTYKKFRAEATTLYRVVDSTCSLAAIGLRHSKLAAEVEKTLTSPLPNHEQTNTYQKALNAIAELIGATYKVARVEPDVMRPIHLKLGRSFALHIAKNMKPGSRYKFTRAEDVPDDLAFALPFNTTDEFAWTWKNFEIINIVLPWMATVEAEEMYLPAEYISDARLSYEPSEIMPLLLGIRDAEYRSPGDTRTTPKGSDRNAPCPCGSGIKYKRCCLGKKA